MACNLGPSDNVLFIEVSLFRESVFRGSTVVADGHEQLNSTMPK